MTDVILTGVGTCMNILLYFPSKIIETVVSHGLRLAGGVKAPRWVSSRIRRVRGMSTAKRLPTFDELYSKIEFYRGIYAAAFYGIVSASITMVHKVSCFDS